MTALGCEELVTRSPEEYEQKILHLAQNAAALATAKANIRANRERMPLFDTRNYTRDFEKLLIDAFESRRTSPE